MRRFKFSLFLFIPFLLLSSCATIPILPPLAETMAILPFDSESNNVDAPDILQKFVYMAMKPSPYQIPDIEATNAKLVENGIIDGGQLPVIDPIKLADDLGVQLLMYGNVESFGYTNVGVYASRHVTLNLWVVDGKTGERIWEDTGKVANRTFGLNEEDIKKNFAAGCFSD